VARFLEPQIQGGFGPHAALQPQPYTRSDLGFWDAAAEDYGKPITTMTKLITGVMAKMIAAAQPAGDQAVTRMVPARKAA
jgi:hypothetical protein